MQNNKNNIHEFKRHDKDTGSIEFQIASLTERINNLSEHFKINAKDYSSRRGLLLMVGKRRRFLRYIERHDPSKYKELISRLGLRK